MPIDWREAPRGLRNEPRGELRGLCLGEGTLGEEAGLEAGDNDRRGERIPFIGGTGTDAAPKGAKCVDPGCAPPKVIGGAAGLPRLPRGGSCRNGKGGDRGGDRGGEPASRGIDDDVGEVAGMNCPADCCLGPDDAGGRIDCGRNLSSNRRCCSGDKGGEGPSSLRFMPVLAILKSLLLCLCCLSSLGCVSGAASCGAG